MATHLRDVRLGPETSNDCLRGGRRRRDAQGVLGQMLGQRTNRRTSGGCKSQEDGQVFLVRISQGVWRAKRRRRQHTGDGEEETEKTERHFKLAALGCVMGTPRQINSRSVAWRALRVHGRRWVPTCERLHTTLMCRKLCFQRLNKDDAAVTAAMAADTERKQGSGIFVDYLRFPYVFRTCVLLYRMFHVAVAGFLFIVAVAQSVSGKFRKIFLYPWGAFSAVFR